MEERKKALGRGLDALFGEMKEVVSVNAANHEETVINEEYITENTIQFVDIDDIKPNKMQPRQEFELAEIESLAESIELHGVIQPVILRKSDVGYEMVAGERRWRAARKAGLKTIPSIIKDLPDEENALVALIENMQRKDLNAMEEANAFKAIIEKYDLTQYAIAKAVGKSRPHVANTLRLLNLPDAITTYISEGKLTLGHANALGAVREASEQKRLAEKIVRDGLSVRDAEKLCARGEIGAKGAKKSTKAKDSEIVSIEDDLTSTLGTKVIINDNGKSGSVELKYFDRAGLNDIIDILREVKRK